MGSHHLLPASLGLKPLQQGHMSSLCGLYSAINAVRLAIQPHRLNKTQLHVMYVRGIDGLSSRRKLKTVLGHGMNEDLWFALIGELIDYANETLNLSLKPVKTLTGDAAQNRRSAIVRVKQDVRLERPVLVCLLGALNHYSVICGYAGERLILFDSSGFRWVCAGNIGLGDNSQLTHRISAQSTFSIIDDW